MRKPKLLVVDDDPSMLSILKRMLGRHAGWDAAFVLGGAAGVAAIENDSYDAVVTDLEMPVVDGHAVLAAARRRGVKVRIVFTGSAATSGTGDAHAILAKPQDVRRLPMLIERLLERHRD